MGTHFSLRPGPGLPLPRVGSARCQPGHEPRPLVLAGFTCLPKMLNIVSPHNHRTCLTNTCSTAETLELCKKPADKVALSRYLGRISYGKGRRNCQDVPGLNRLATEAGCCP